MKKTNSFFFFLSIVTVIVSSSISADSGGHVVFDNNGNGVAVWEDPVSGGTQVQAATYSFSNDSWSSPATLSSSGVASSQPQIAMAVGGFYIGDAVAIWSGFNSTHGVDSIYAAMKPNGQSWTSPGQVSSNTENVSEYEIRINNAGNIVALWTSSDANGNQYVRSASAQSSSSNSWNSPITVSGP
jgi:hypothetical protein